MNVADMQTMIKDFQKAGMKLEMQGEMMTDAMDMGDAVDEEADDIYNGILGEVGLDVAGAQVGATGIASQKVANPIAPVANEEVDDLDARLAALQ